MPIPTEPIGSIPRPPALIDAVAAKHGDMDDPAPEPLFDAAVKDTMTRFEATGSPGISDGEQRRYHNFWDYCVHGLPNTATRDKAFAKIAARVEGTGLAADILGAR